MKKRYIVTACLFLVSLTAALVLFITRANYRDIAAESFGKDYARISVFPENTLGFDEINSLRFAIDSNLKADSHSAEGRLWYDSFTGFGEAYVEKTDMSSYFRATSMIAGGDFFVLHKFDFLSGDRFYPDDNYTDRVVIDERCAFKLYGSTNCIGMPLVVNAEMRYVAGVVKAEESEAWTLQFGDKPFVIVPDDYMAGNSYSVYEIVLPDPVDGYAEGVVKNAAGESALTVDVTNRYGMSNLFENLADFFHRSYVTRPVAFPWFENVERGRVDTLSVMLLAWLVSLVTLSVSIIYVIIRGKK